MQVAADDLGSQLPDCRDPPGVVTWTGRDCNRLWFQTQGDVQGGVGDLAAPFTLPITIGHQNHSYLLFRLPSPGQPAGVAPALWASLMAKPGFSLHFAPTRIEVAASKDLAYDVGTFEFKLNDDKALP
jgi:hypothetical protein